MRTSYRLKGIIAVFAIAAIVMVAQATKIVHTHSQVGQSTQRTPLPTMDYWKCKAEAPSSGTLYAAFEFLESFAGYTEAANGDKTCGAKTWVTSDYNFKTHAQITSGVAKGTAWDSNETKIPICSTGQQG